MKKRRLFILATGLMFLVGTLFVWMNSFHAPPRDSLLLPTSFYTVDEVWENAQTLAGQRIAVRGWTRFVSKSVESKCFSGCDNTCSFDKHIQLAVIGDQQIITTDALSCHSSGCCADNCSLTCTPFDPRNISAFEIVGTVTLYRHSEQITEVRLVNVDVMASSQLAGLSNLGAKNRLPLQVGEFTFQQSSLRQSLFVPTPIVTPSPIIVVTP